MAPFCNIGLDIYHLFFMLLNVSLYLLQFVSMDIFNPTKFVVYLFYLFIKRHEHLLNLFLQFEQPLMCFRYITI